MKAVCVLLCLALVRFSAGHIFRRERYPAMDYLNIPQQMNGIYQRFQEYYQPQEQQQQQNLQWYKNKHQDHGHSSDSTSNESNSQQQQKQNLQWYKNKHQSHGHSSDSTSNESNSHETQVVITKYYPQAHNVYTSDRSQVIEAAYGDPIVWKNVKIAVNPKSQVNEKDIDQIFSGAYETIQHMSKESQEIFHQAYQTVANTDNEDSHLNATQLLRKNHYNVEEHTIKTEDGYFLTMFRIVPKEMTSEPRPVVFLMHGLLGSADDWLLMGPGKSLAYLLADLGYDVWLGNARGTKYSRRHVSKHPAQSDFWQYGIDEIALQDLPAMIDYALQMSNQKKMYYVGYSEGTTVLFALASTRPEYNEKIIMMYALSPLVYMSHVRSPMFRMIAPTSPFYERLHEQLGHGRFMPSKELVQTVGGDMCKEAIGCPNMCSHINFVMAGVGVENLDVDLIPLIMSHLPDGVSTRVIKHLAQGVSSNEFTKYNYGSGMNGKVYGTNQPPKYDMTKVQFPVALYWSDDDWLAHPKDVQRLEKELNNVESYKVPTEHFSHMDFQFSRKAPEVVYQRLINSMQKQNSRNYVY